MTSIVQGTVTVADNGVAAGSGCALSVYYALVSQTTFPNPAQPPIAKDEYMGTTHVLTPAWAGTAQEWYDEALATILSIKRGLAKQATAIASIIPYLVANMQIQTPVAVAGLQRLPDPIVVGATTDAPAAPVNLTGTVI